MDGYMRWKKCASRLSGLYNTMVWRGSYFGYSSTARVTPQLARYQLLQVSAQVFENLLLARLDFKKDRFGQPDAVLPRMNSARFQEHSPQVADALLSQQHLIVGLNQGSSSSTIPRFLKLLDV
jgi:hypothetical protein